ncbi:MAG: nodulation protein NfeD [Spirochaetales bacterium]|nr:nodulation protein NfeD [Spirochaetales bacterium]
MKKIILICFIILLLFSTTAFTKDSTSESPDVFIIPIDGLIDRSLTVFIRRGLEQADSLGTDMIIFEINTFGGLVESALQIATLIGSAEQHTAAYIPANPETTGVSWSAGALISFACNQIFMSPGTSIGAAAPVYTSTEGTVLADEKTISAVRAQMAALAEKNGYPRAAALAMVDSDIELIEVYIDDELRLIDSADLEAVENEASADGQEVRKGRTVSKEGKLLTFTALDMEKYGISSGTPESRKQLFEMLGFENPSTAEFETSIPDKLIAVVTGSSLTAILIMLGLGALYMEITSPGFGIPGTLAIIIFTVIFVSNSMLGYVGSLEILLFLVGIILLLVEIFLIPGFGAAGISGFLLIAASLLLSQQDFIVPEFTWQWDILQANLMSIGFGILGSIVLIAVFFNVFPRIGVFNRLILNSSQQKTDGFAMQNDPADMNLVGKTGIAVTTLRPSGKANIDGGIMAVETDGDFLDAGTKVVILEVNSNRIVVRGL